MAKLEPRESFEISGFHLEFLRLFLEPSENHRLLCAWTTKLDDQLRSVPRIGECFLLEFSGASISEQIHIAVVLVICLSDRLKRALRPGVLEAG